jgi:Ni/Co efflux regulator RcnB
MRKIVLTLAALAAVGFVLPAATTSASAETVVIKKGHRDHGWHRGWHEGRRHDRVVVREREGFRHHRHHGVGVVIR